MNGFEVLGRQLKCHIIDDRTGAGQPMKQIVNQQNRDMDLEEDTGAQYIHSAQSRLLLMQKLSRGESGILPATQNQDQGQAIKNQNFTNHPAIAQYT